MADDVTLTTQHIDARGGVVAVRETAWRQLETASSAIVHLFHARPDILQLCGFAENLAIRNLCDALNACAEMPDIRSAADQGKENDH